MVRQQSVTLFSSRFESYPSLHGPLMKHAIIPVLHSGFEGCNPSGSTKFFVLSSLPTEQEWSLH